MSEKAGHTAHEAKIADLRARKARVMEMGGAAAVERHRASGRLPVRERLDLLLDPGSWFEFGALALPEMRTERFVPGDGVVTGFGRIDGAMVGVIGIDSTILAGTTAPTSMRKQSRLIEHAQRFGFPIVLLCDADGGRIPDVMGWRFSGLPLDFLTFVKPAPGQAAVPRAAAILGPSYGDSALHASTAHFTVMIASGAVALSGPSVIQSAIGEAISDTELGGPEPAQAAGNVHMVVGDEHQAMQAIAAFLSYLPANAELEAPVAPARPASRPAEDFERLVPLGAKAGYDMRHVLEALVDEGSLLPWGAGWGPSLLTGLARIEGMPVGIVANQPIVNAGALDPAALVKECAFVDLCDTFNLPLVFLNDVPGLMIGSQAERGGILKAYEALVARIAEATVPKVAVVLRKAYGGGHFAMGGRPTRPDFLFAWPCAEMGFMAPETGVRTVYRRRMEQVLEAEGQAAMQNLVDTLTAEWTVESEPWEAAAHLSFDDIIEPAQTRVAVARGIEIAWGPRRPRLSRSRPVR
ncbi:MULTISPECIES: carboxyl transferase domain-containing protein [unclassified Chelatococcus]|uniref:acyl-CoA carboxylase subunit beta n=1 Tax=unclassified Chelatococcus TaxID=2638111 RepID=UPI001BD03168|nr:MULTISPECIES: carboxyl transferase domain-containing protein [unclassified Chelatococcus]CAH1653046.1 Acetyl-CoA carboxylase carboxyltransferase component [Hyphomicrobiales bacterium]MBS7742953.1 hypothetical protein [Chelatococcus sp. HY11]MBX3541929.1 hypothetical protein [Chelatococcus sp.]MCO5074180.1 hypothetical protein [Chelatococcus sp.]CAH1694197.1 Acetyl-CoA carboxylase carboxyltransferase component [Hyphomicrobiales bacterium]